MPFFLTVVNTSECRHHSHFLFLYWVIRKKWHHKLHPQCVPRSKSELRFSIRMVKRFLWLIGKSSIMASYHFIHPCSCEKIFHTFYCIRDAHIPQVLYNNGVQLPNRILTLIFLYKFSILSYLHATFNNVHNFKSIQYFIHRKLL